MILKEKQTIVSIAVMCALSVANIAFAESGLWRIGAGKAVDVSGMDTESYQVTGLNRKKDGSYVVHVKAAGFQSDIQLDVTFDGAGQMVETLNVTGQAETEGMGSRVTEEVFTGQFAGIEAPVTLKGKDIAVVSPTTGLAYGEPADGGQEEAAREAAAEGFDPETWNAQDQSPEAKAMRTLYRSGLTASAMENRQLETPFADLSAEEQAQVRLDEAGLLAAEAAAEESAAAEAAGAGITEVDAVSGATVSSTAVVTAANNAYYFLHEQVLGDQVQ